MKYKDVKQNGIQVNILEEDAFNWIIEHYKNKEVQWLISSNSTTLTEMDTLFIPIEEINSYFDVKIVLRRKKSGSQNLPKKEKEVFLKMLRKKGYNYESSDWDGKYFKVLISSLKDEIVEIDRYLLKKREDNWYRVTKKSLTNNPNILFELKLKKDIIKFKSEEFLKSMR